MNCRIRYLASILVPATLAAWTAFAQTPAPRLEFEVASIKPAELMKGGDFRVGMGLDGSRLTYSNVALRDCIRVAYGVKDYQLSTPDWVAGARFDIMAKLPEGATREQVPEMLKALLADRFKLTLHHESKDQNVYALVPGKGGLKLKESDPNAELNFGSGGPGGAPGGGIVQQQVSMTRGEGGRGGGGTSVTMGQNGAQIESRKVTLAGFADMLSRYVDRPVLDMTETKGIYDFTLNVSMEDLARGNAGLARKAAAMSAAQPEGHTDSGAGGSIFGEVQKYGLKLEARKAPMDMLVVDQIEKAPTEN